MLIALPLTSGKAIHVNPRHVIRVMPHGQKDGRCGLSVPSDDQEGVSDYDLAADADAVAALLNAAECPVWLQFPLDPTDGQAAGVLRVRPDAIQAFAGSHSEGESMVTSGLMTFYVTATPEQIAAKLGLPPA